MNVYDFDKTIYKDDSSHDFYLFNLKKNPIILIHGIRQLLAFIAYSLHLITKTEMKTIFYTYFKSIKNMDERVLEFWDKHEHNVFDYYFLQKHPTDVIISASPEFMLKPICDKWGVNLIASIVDKKTGYSKENCFGKEKVIRFRELYPDAHVNSFYSDSLSDTPMALIADESFLVTPDGIQPWPKS
jgi:phosphatidylglycerophosphatase C